MPSEITINISPFGSITSLADSLIIDISESRIGFCEWNSVYAQPVYVVNYSTSGAISMSLTEHVLNAVKHFQFHQKVYKEVLVNYSDKHFTLCPRGFYKAENAREILEFNVGPINSKLILTDEINSDILLIYAVDEQLKSTLDKLYPQHQIKHSISVLSKLLLSEEELLQENILLNIQGDFIQILVKMNEKLALVNQFSVKTEEDVLYYLLFVLEQYQFNPLSVCVTIAGNIESNASFISLAKKYIKHLRLARGNKTINWSLLTGMPQHFNYNLINRIFCE